MKSCFAGIVRWNLGLIVGLMICGQANAQTWQAGLQLASGSSSCWSSAAVFKFTMMGDDLSILTPAGPTYRGSVAPDGNVMIQFKGADGGDVAVSGNARTRDLRLVNSKYKGCTYALVAYDGPVNGQAARAKTLDACAQQIPYTIQPPDPATPATATAFLGAWVGQWDRWPFPGSAVPVTETQCIAFIVERVDGQGNASLIYVEGQKYRVKPGFGRRTGKIIGNRLYSPKPPNGVYDISLTLTTPTHLEATKREGIWPGRVDKQQ